VTTKNNAILIKSTPTYTVVSL